MIITCVMSSLQEVNVSVSLIYAAYLKQSVAHPKCFPVKCIETMKTIKAIKTIKAW